MDAGLNGNCLTSYSHGSQNTHTHTHTHTHTTVGSSFSQDTLMRKNNFGELKDLLTVRNGAKCLA